MVSITSGPPGRSTRTASASTPNGRVINGPGVLAYDTNKARQLSLFRKAGLDVPKTRVAHRRADADEIRKAAVGGSRMRVVVSRQSEVPGVLTARDEWLALAGKSIAAVRRLADGHHAGPHARRIRRRH